MEYDKAKGRFKGELPMWSLRGLHESTDFVETFASLRSRNASSYFLHIIRCKN
jgi:hypothetical protein